MVYGGRSFSVYLADTYRIKMYICTALGPAGPTWSLFTEFCSSSARTRKVSTTTIASKTEQEKNACARCMHYPKRVLHIPFRTASACQLKLNEVFRCTEGLFDCMTFVVRFFVPLWRLPDLSCSLRWLIPGHIQCPRPNKPPAAKTSIPT